MRGVSARFLAVVRRINCSPSLSLILFLCVCCVRVENSEEK